VSNKSGKGVFLHASVSASAGSDDSPGWVRKGNQVAVWAIIAAGINLAYSLYNRLGGDVQGTNWICLGILTQVLGFLVRFFVKALRKVTNKKAWLRNLVVFQSVGLSFFSHGVFGNRWTGSLIGLSLAVGLWAFKMEAGDESTAVSYPLLTTLRVNEIVQVVAAKRLFVPVLSGAWSSVGALALAVLPSCLQYVGGVAEGDYAEADKKEGERLAGYLLYLASFLLLTAFTREFSGNIPDRIVARSGLGLVAGEAGKKSGRGLFSRSGDAAGEAGMKSGLGLFSRSGNAAGEAAKESGRGLLPRSGKAAGEAGENSGRGLLSRSGNAAGEAGKSGLKLPFDVVVKIQAN